MPKVNALIHSFNAGELSVAGLARVDQEKVRLCAELQENLIPHTIGKALMRPGTKYLGTLSSSTSLVTNPPRIIPFARSVDSAYVLNLSYYEAGEEEATTDTEVYVYNSSGTYSLILDGNATSISVQTIAGGGNGAAGGSGSSGNGGGGGGSGAYAATTSIDVIGGQTVYLRVGGIGDPSWVNIDSNAPPTSTSQGAYADYGRSASGNNGGNAGSSGKSIGDVTYSGADGGDGAEKSGGGGGAGAAGPNGTGKGGGGAVAVSGDSGGGGGGGGGGSNGGSSTSGATATGKSGGNGGKSTAGTSGGGGGTFVADDSTGDDGATGSSGSGSGGGAYSNNFSASTGGDGGNGTSDTTIATLYGSGSGGGGGGAAYFYGTATGGPGGSAGTYGGGGGGGGYGYTDGGSAGSGARGLVVITVTTTVYGSINGKLSVWENDAETGFNEVTSTVGAFTTFTATTAGGATATLGADYFTASAFYNGGYATVKKEVSTSSANLEHALKVRVASGVVNFRIGSTDGDDDYFGSSTLGVGYHILSFTPSTSSYFITFKVTTTYTTRVTLCEIYNSTSKTLQVPGQWDAGALRSIRYDQSLDVIFMAIPSFPPQKIERRGSRSWSVSEYLPDNGPLRPASSDSTISLTPSATRGDITLTASSAFFEDHHVGSLFKLTHDKLDATYGIAGADEKTPAFLQVGIEDDRDFSVVVSGTWVGTIAIQRSFDSDNSGFRNYDSFNVNGTYNKSQETTDNNALIWYRVAFVAYTSGSATVRIVYHGASAEGVCRITAVNSSTSADAVVLSDLGNTAKTYDWFEGEWNSSRGYPTAVTLFDGRLWWARGDRFWGSESDDYYSFDVTVEGDSASIERNIATGGTMSEIVWMLPLQRLLFGTSGAEASARSSSLDEPLTPGGITIRDGSTQGSADVTPVKIDGRGLCVQRSRRKIMELAFDAASNDYISTDLTRYNETIGLALNGARITGLVSTDIFEIAVQRQPDTYLLAMRDDAVIPITIYNPSQDVVGWFRITLGRSSSNFGSYLKYDKVVSAAIIPGEVEDSVYFVVHRRTDPDTYSYMLEKLGHQQDTAYIVVDDASENTVKKYNGLYQLDSYEIFTVNDDGYTIDVSSRMNGWPVMVIGPYYDSSGNITGYGTIGSTYDVDDTLVVSLSDVNQYRAGATVTVGLPYYGKYKSAKLAYGAQHGTSVSQYKRIANLSLLLSDYNPAGVKIGPDFDNLDDLPAVVDGVLVEYDGELGSPHDKDMVPFPGEWSVDARVCIQVEPGCTATLNGIVIGVEINED
jgi:hypothetical protein